MLFGEYQHSIDAKGRVNFPSKLREGLGTTFMICKGLSDPCLFVYSMEGFEEFRKKLDELPMEQSKKIKRVVFAGACEAEPDKQGRIVIPASLRAYANLSKDVMVIGASDRAEIWDKDQWEKCCEEITPEFIAQATKHLNI
ncbi:MAG: division/cell wall cluster transcriptional repressor MraZ [Oscillospiraceae bacterium]|nr:division/cell wall cluster transcriptional repressor MraZ [Oscillospiraceae bacterium]